MTMNKILIVLLALVGIAAILAYLAVYRPFTASAWYHYSTPYVTPQCWECVIPSPSPSIEPSIEPSASPSEIPSPSSSSIPTTDSGIDGSVAPPALVDYNLCTYRDCSVHPVVLGVSDYDGSKVGEK